MRFAVHVEGGGPALYCRADQSVLAAMMHVCQRDIPVGCRSGGCGVCRVRLLSGRYRLGLMSKHQVTDDAAAQGYALACQLYPDSDLRVVAVGRIVSAVSSAQRVAAAAEDGQPVQLRSA